MDDVIGDFFRYCEEGDIQNVINRLTDNAVDINSEMRRGNYNEYTTPLIVASTYGHKDIVKILLDSGANIEDSDEHRHTALFLACQHGYFDIIKILLNRGANVNSYEEHGVSCLAMASCKGNNDIVKMLLDHGADIEYADVNGEGPLFNSISACFISDYLDVTTTLLEHGANIEVRNHEGCTPLISASKYGTKARGTIEMLIEYGADVEAKDDDGNIFIHYLKGEYKEEMEKFILGIGGRDIKPAKQG